MLMSGAYRRDHVTPVRGSLCQEKRGSILPLQPLAIAIISGLLVQVPLVLLVMPNVYAWLSGIVGVR
ncbi:MAG: hypothetical protein WBM54_14065 [Woeseia sp.]